MINSKTFFNLAIISSCLLFSSTLFAAPPAGKLECSEDSTEATINEINFSGGAQSDFIEIKILETDVKINDWELCTQTGTDPSKPAQVEVTCVSLGAGNLTEYFYGNPQGTMHPLSLLIPVHIYNGNYQVTLILTLHMVKLFSLIMTMATMK